MYDSMDEDRSPQTVDTFCDRISQQKMQTQVLPIDFVFSSVCSSPDSKFKGTRDSKELPSKLQIQSQFTTVYFPSLGNVFSWALQIQETVQFRIISSPVPPHPTPLFFLPSVLACKPCCFNFFPVLPVLLEHFIFNSQLIWRSATLRFNCL